MKTRKLGQYFLTLIIVSITTVIQWFLYPLIEPAPYILFYPAIILASLYGDGFFAIILSVIGAQYFFVTPVFSIEHNWPNDYVRQIIFILSGLMIRQVTRMLAASFRKAQESKEWFSKTLECIGDAVIATDKAGNVAFMNPIAEKLTQWTLEEAKGKPLAVVFHIVNQETRLVVDNPVAKVFETGHIVGLANHTVIIGKHGAEAAIEDSAAPIRIHEGGTIQGVVLVFRDITDKYAHEKELAETLKEVQSTEARFRKVLENALDAVVGMDDKGLITHWNPQAEKIFGFKEKEVLGQRLSEKIIPQKYREPHEKGMEQFLKTGIGPVLNNRIEITALNSRREEFPVELSITPIYFGKGVFFSAFIRDISDQKRMMREMELISGALENSLNGFDIIDCNGKFIYANASYLKMWGYDSASEVIGTSPADHCADPKIPEKIIGMLKSTGQCDIEFLAKRKDGSTFDVRMLARLAYDSEGNEVYPTTSIDITEKKRVDEQFRVLANSMSQLSWMADSHGWIYWYNDRWYDYTGTTFEDMAGWGWQKIHHPDHLPRIMEFLKTGWHTAEPFELTFPLRSKEGEWRWFLTRAVPIKDNKGDVIRWFGTNTDIQEQKETEEALIKATQEAHEAIRVRDEFLSIASHELKTPLTSLTLQSQIRRRQLDKGLYDAFKLENIPAMVDADLKQLGRLSRLIDDMLDISRFHTGKLNLQKEAVNLCALVQEVVDRLRPQFSEASTLIEMKNCDSAMVKGDAYRLEQVVANLLTNSLKYGQGKPVIVEVTTRNGKAYLSVVDQGIGIPRDDQQRIFSRFERAVPASEISGLGLGLSIARDIIEAHGGKILVESEVNQGSKFLVELPLI